MSSSLAGTPTGRPITSITRNSAADWDSWMFRSPALALGNVERPLGAQMPALTEPQDVMTGCYGHLDRLLGREGADRNAVDGDGHWLVRPAQSGASGPGQGGPTPVQPEGSLTALQRRGCHRRPPDTPTRRDEADERGEHSRRHHDADDDLDDVGARIKVGHEIGRAHV